MLSAGTMAFSTKVLFRSLSFYYLTLFLCIVFSFCILCLNSFFFLCYLLILSVLLPVDLILLYYLLFGIICFVLLLGCNWLYFYVVLLLSTLINYCFCCHIVFGRDSSVSKVTGRDPDDWCSIPGRDFLFATKSKWVLGSTQPPVQWVPGALSSGVMQLITV
jgi:hypothetical protein